MGKADNSPFLTYGEQRFMFTFTESERGSLTAAGRLSTNSQGREVFMGLTEDETATYMEHERRVLVGDRDREGRVKHRALHEKFERAHCEVIGATIYLRNKKPLRH